MFTNLHIISDNDCMQTMEGLSLEAELYTDDVFDNELDPSVAIDTTVDLSFLDTLLAPIPTPRKWFLTASGDDDINVFALGAKDPPPTSVRPKKKARRPSHIIVKERREKLLAQVRHLEVEAVLLRHETGVVDPDVDAAKRELNLNLRDAVLQHDMVLASNQSALSGYMKSRATSPLETYIHLGMDWSQRRRALLGMRDWKIATAHQFLTERTRHMNPFRPSSEVSKFETEQGDVCTVKVDVTPLEGVKSVREVFDALQFYFANMEITKTELSGKITIRENEASIDDLVMQHRVTTSEGSGVSQESNLIVFYDTSGLNAANADDQCVLMASDSVDRDDIYPYRPSERLRKDASSAMKLSAHRRRRPQATSGNDSEDELVVVFTRVFFVRLHRPQFNVPELVLQSISDDMVSNIDVMLKSMKEGLAGPMKQERV